MPNFYSERSLNQGMMFLVTTTYIRFDGTEEIGRRGPYLTLTGARKHKQRLQKFIDDLPNMSSWFKERYSGAKIEIEATLVDWKVVE